MSTALVPEEKKPNEDTISASASYALPGVLPPVVFKKASSSKEHHKIPRLAGYQVHEHIGGGTFGDVYRAQWTQGTPSESLPLAIKLLHKSGKYVKASADTKREISILKDLVEHDNIIRLLAWRETHFNTQLIMPLYDQDLRKLLRPNGVNADVAMRLSRDLLHALQYLSMKKVLHRDIKPANSLVQNQPLAARLGDFGAARYVLPISASHEGEEAGLSSDVCTMWYRAPEVLITRTHYHFPSDVWSMGISMAELEVGHPPFRAPSEIGMLFAACSVLGTPSSADWAEFGLGSKGLLGVLSKPIMPKFLTKIQKPWGVRFGHAFADLITRLLNLLPSHRVSASEALKSQWFTAAFGAK